MAFHKGSTRFQGPSYGPSYGILLAVFQQKRVGFRKATSRGGVLFLFEVPVGLPLEPPSKCPPARLNPNFINLLQNQKKASQYAQKSQDGRQMNKLPQNAGFLQQCQNPAQITFFSLKKVQKIEQIANFLHDFFKEIVMIWEDCGSFSLKSQFYINFE